MVGDFGLATTHLRGGVGQEGEEVRAGLALEMEGGGSEKIAP